MSVAAETERKPKGNFLLSAETETMPKANFRRRNRNRSRILVGLYQQWLTKRHQFRLEKGHAQGPQQRHGRRNAWQHVTNGAGDNSFAWSNRHVEKDSLSLTSTIYLITDITQITPRHTIRISLLIGPGSAGSREDCSGLVSRVRQMRTSTPQSAQPNSNCLGPNAAQSNEFHIMRSLFPP